MMDTKKCLIYTILLLSLFANNGNSLQFIPENLREKYGDALEAIFGMGVRLQTLLNPQISNETESKNFIISPISAAMVIGQLMLGTEGPFEQHLYDLLSLPKSMSGNVANNFNFVRLHQQLGTLIRELKEQSVKKDSFTLATSNALFYNQKLQLLPSFDHEIRILYDTELHSVNFKKSMESLNYINKWASDHTNGLIKNILSSPPGANTAAIFANSIYFLGKWEQPFSYELNTQAPFFTGSDGKSVSTEFMTGFMEQIPYAESKSLNCKLMVLPYVGGDVRMYFILPNVGHPLEYDINKFARSAKVAEWLKLLEDLKDRDVVAKIPKLSLTSSLSLLQPLQKYAVYKQAQSHQPHLRVELKSRSNVYDVLEDKINKFENFTATNLDDVTLSKAAFKTQVKISDILQQMTFSVNEFGTEAAAVSASIIDYNGGSKSFLANKPFMFFIRHEKTAATLFWGTISNPLK